MKRVYAAVFGSGLGHVTRVQSIAQKLQSESDCYFLYSSFDEGYRFLKRNGELVNYCPSVDLRWNFAGGVSGGDTLVRFPYAFLGFAKQILFEMEKITSYNPRVVLSDSRLSAVFAAKSRLYPVITILNQIRILFPPRFRKGVYGDFLERIEGDMLGLFWSASNEILFPDLPPPFTIGEANVSGIDVSNKIRFTGFMVPKFGIPAERFSKVRSMLQLDSRPIVFMQISGPNATKEPFIKSALESSNLLSRNYNVIISKGLPSGSTLPMKLANGTWIYDWCPIKDELFLLSDVLVGRSGHTTISQCINAGKPSVLVPIYNHSEQIWNAEKFVRLGLGIAIRSENLNSGLLESSVERCMEDNTFRKSVEGLKRISDRYDGLETASDVMRGFL